jgi:soluble lytic murein transglycosylase
MLKVFEEIKARCDEDGTGDVQVNCADMDTDLVLTPTDDSFYGYLIRMDYLSHGSDVKIQHKTASKPHGEQYDRIEALAFLGMRDEAVSEIDYAFKRIKSPDHYFYLASLAAELSSYRESLYIAESRKEKEYLPYSYPLGFWDSIQEASQRENIDAYLIAALIREESRFDPKAVSWAGAVGLMQLMPSTARRMNESLRLEFNGSQDLQVPSKNIALGAHYLSKLVKELEKPPLVLAAYNAGEKTLYKWMESFSSEDLIEFIENIPYQETRRYIKKVLKSYWQYRAINGLSLFGPEVAFNIPVDSEGNKGCC